MGLRGSCDGGGGSLALPLSCCVLLGGPQGGCDLCWQRCTWGLMHPRRTLAGLGGWGPCVRGSDGFPIPASVAAEGAGSGCSLVPGQRLGVRASKAAPAPGSEAGAPCTSAHAGSSGPVVLGSAASVWQAEYPQTLLGFFTALGEVGEVAWSPPSLCWASGL